MMMHNTYGSKFRLEIWGASHAPEVGIRISGVPQGIALSESDFEADLSRRRASAKGTTTRHEADIPILRSGVADGVTTGEPIEIVFQNGDTCCYKQYRHSPRELTAATQVYLLAILGTSCKIYV